MEEAKRDPDTAPEPPPVEAQPTTKSIKQKWNSRNWLAYLLAFIVATSWLMHAVSKCERNGVYDHGYSNTHFNTWSNSVAIFWLLFMVQKEGSKLVDKIRGFRTSRTR